MSCRGLPHTTAAQQTRGSSSSWFHVSSQYNKMTSKTTCVLLLLLCLDTTQLLCIFYFCVFHLCPHYLPGEIKLFTEEFHQFAFVLFYDERWIHDRMPWSKSDTEEKMDIRYTFLSLSDLPDTKPLPRGASSKQIITL